MVLKPKQGRRLVAGELTGLIFRGNSLKRSRARIERIEAKYSGVQAILVTSQQRFEANPGNPLQVGLASVRSLSAAAQGQCS